MKPDLPKSVVDTNGTKYAVGDLLGSGAQGTVYAVRDQALAIKIATAGSSLATQNLRENIARVKRLPLQGLNVARPLRALRQPLAGYVMELMTDMRPLASISRVPPDKTADLSRWYIDTGGLKRRLRLLARTADLFSELHSRGMSYGDASPHNIFISSDLSESEVWLIDSDNICQGVSRRALYTPGYAAPELLKGHLGSDTLTDAWSLAVLIFEILSGVHPLVGDMVNEGETELEDQAFAGELPWIDDQSDQRNASSMGIPRNMVMTKHLQQLAAECFGASRADRLKRPGAANWAEKLRLAADQTLVCSECSASYFPNARLCPWCGTPRPSFALVNVYLRDPGQLTNDSSTPFHVVCRTPGKPVSIARMTVQEGQSAQLLASHLTGGRDGTPLVDLSLDGPTLKVAGMDSCTYVLENRTSGKQRELNAKPIPLNLSAGKTAWWLVPEQTEKLHRVAGFQFHEAAD